MTKQSITHQPADNQQVAAQTQSKADQPLAGDKSDKVSKTRTLYDAGSGEIFWKNFLAGIARGLGGILIWMLFLIFLAFMFTQVFWPQIEPFFNDYRQLIQTFSALQTTSIPSSTGASPSPVDLNQLLESDQVQDLIQQLPR